MLADEDNPLEADLPSGDAAPTDPQVVVIYRSRGVPWLLIPPLLLLSAVVAIVGFRRLQALEFPALMSARPPASAVVEKETPAKTDAQPAKPIVATVYQTAEAKAAEAKRKEQISLFPGPDVSTRPKVPNEPVVAKEAAVAKEEITPPAAAPLPPVAPVVPAKPAELVGPPKPPPSLIAAVPSPEIKPSPAPVSPPVLSRPPLSFALVAPPLATAEPFPAVAPTPAPPALMSTDPPAVVATPIGEVPIEPPVKRDAVGFDPEAAKVLSAEIAAAAKKKGEQNAPKPEPRPNSAPLNGMGPQRVPSEEMIADMQREAEQRLAERAGLEAAKPDLLNPDPLEVENRRHRLYAATMRLAAQDRVPFHDDLRRVIADKGNRAGRDIQQIANLYGRDTMPEIHGAMNRDLLGPASRLSPAARIERMRRWGVPEAIILDDLVETERQNISARNGPRNEMEVWVYAARSLLATPPSKSAINAPRARTATTTPGGR